MDAKYAELKSKLESMQSEISAALSICDGMSGEENAEGESDSSPSSPPSGSGYSGGGGDNKIKAAVARIRMGKA